MNELSALVVVLFLSATGLILLPWVGFMAIVVVLVLCAILVCHFWDRYYMELVFGAADRILSPPAVGQVLPWGTMRLAFATLALVAGGLVVVPGLVAAVALPVVGVDHDVPFLAGHFSASDSRASPWCSTTCARSAAAVTASDRAT